MANGAKKRITYGRTLYTLVCSGTVSCLVQVLTSCCSNPELHEVTQRNIVPLLVVASLNGRYTQSALYSEPPYPVTQCSTAQRTVDAKCRGLPYGVWQVQSVRSGSAVTTVRYNRQRRSTRAVFRDESKLFRDVTPCSSVDRYRRFGESCSLQVHGKLITRQHAMYLVSAVSLPTACRTTHFFCVRVRSRHTA